MERNTDKEKWIDEALGSVAGMRRAAPAAGLYEKVSANLSKGQHTKPVLAQAISWAAAAVLLVALNVGSVIHFTRQSQSGAKTNNTNPLMAEMQSGTTYNY